jgi:thioredoxin reductase
MTSEIPPHSDIVIIGAGPSGLAAATQLRKLGVGSVLVLDREPHAGGIPRHCGHYPFGTREFGRVLKGPDYARKLVTAAMAAGVRICTNVTVTSMTSGPVLQVTTPDGLRDITANLVLLAMGARETPRAARLIGGTKPAGIVTTGTLQSMTYLHHQRAFRRPVILGTELVAFSAIMTCRHLGMRPVAMIEPNTRTTARWPTGLFPYVMGVPLYLDTELIAIHGKDRVTGATIKDQNGPRDIACDGVITSGHFRPDASLLRDSHLQHCPHTGGPEIDQYGRCSDPAYFAAGNLLRAIETAGWSWREGHRLAHIMAAALAKKLPSPTSPKIMLRGDALSYCVPQRLAPRSGPDPLPGLQLRVNRPAKGRLVLSVDGQDVITKPIDTLPERRILLPYPDITPENRIDLRLEETNR